MACVLSTIISTLQAILTSKDEYLITVLYSMLVDMNQDTDLLQYHGPGLGEACMRSQDDLQACMVLRYAVLQMLSELGLCCTVHQSFAICFSASLSQSMVVTRPWSSLWLRDGPLSSFVSSALQRCTCCAREVCQARQALALAGAPG